MLYWISIKEKIPEEGIDVLIWNGHSYHVGEILYIENFKVVFLCGALTIDDVQIWTYLPKQPERLSDLESEKTMRQSEQADERA